MTAIKRLALFFLTIFFLLQARGQQSDSLSVKKTNVIPVEHKTTDTTALDMKGVEQMELMAAP
ncbi:MAG: hypothetical protein AB3N14_21110, partial [Flavobacteriaceae bacterium]